MMKTIDRRHAVPFALVTSMFLLWGLANNMTEAALPIVYMVSESGTSFNPLHGYVTNVDESMLHECITPLPEGRKLTIGIGTYGQKITGISYEIRSLDGEEYLENTTVTDYNIITSDTATQGDNVTGQMDDRAEPCGEQLF